MQTVKIGGETYTLQVGFAAGNVLQTLTNKPLGAILTHMAELGTLYLAESFYAAARKDHPKLTLGDCEKLMQTAVEEGALKDVMQAIAVELGRLLNPDAGKQVEQTQKKAPGSRPKA